ncbi:MAG: alpha/beta fold hydrolase [Actinomycetota bacterium]|nr:alpha/beta fold hydrolase [Actinomycetota bacterium]
MGDVELCYETFGADDAPALLMVMGLGSQMLVWEDEFCATLAGHGFRVVRFDNRDNGRSTIFGQAKPPTLRQLMLRDRRGAAYALDDLAADAVGLLDHLGIGSAHVVGASMGGMIAQLVAINHPERADSLVSIMSSTGSWRVGLPRPNLLPLILRRPRKDREGYIEDMVKTFRAIGSKRYPTPEAELRSLAERCFERGISPAGTARQLAAIQTAPDRTPKLRQLRLPATVIHGSRDPLIMPSGGRATAKAIPGAKLLMLDGMGHDLPRPLWPQIIEAILQTVAAARGRA